ncbi:MAG: 5'-nucleotidase/UDP-sugar diphosphatase [Rhodothermales bacterium]|jgi:5'-nucleotidase/UDP-sugar diphosphatase
MIRLLVSLLLASAATAEESLLTILQTTDLHAHVAWAPEADVDGDWLQLATVAREQREAAGRENSLLIDCGDTVQGTLIGDVSEGRVATALLNVMDFDVWVPGNHELDYGSARYASFLEQVTVPTLNGNIRVGERALPAFRIFKRAGLTVAVIGMNSSFQSNWLWGDRMKGMSWEPAVTAVERAMPAVLAAQPDVIILALHHGWLEDDVRGVNEVTAISEQFPQIQLILGGHTHREFSGRRLGRAWYIQSGSHAEFVGRVQLRVKDGAITDIVSELIPTRDAKRDPTAEAAVADWLAKAREVEAKTLYTLPRALTAGGTPGVDCQTSELICAAYAAETGAVGVIHARLSSQSWPAKHRFNEGDLFQLIPYENGVGVALLSEADLRAIIEEQLTRRDHRSFGGIWGFHAEIDATGTRVGRIRLPDREFSPGERIPVAFNSYTIASGGGRFPILRRLLRTPQAKLRDHHINSRTLLRNYLLRTPQFPVCKAWYQIRNVP